MTFGYLSSPVVKVDRRIRWHYTTTILRLRIGARLTRYRNCKFHNFASTISRHADGISWYSVPPSAGPLLPLIITVELTAVGDRSFATTDQRILNGLHGDVTSATPLPASRPKLKAYSFLQSYRTSIPLAPHLPLPFSPLVPSLSLCSSAAFSSFPI